jgi:UDP-N-acetylmuramoyl-L-alanyl-D-glutamate--2,6-diaminopimelate ligase
MMAALAATAMTLGRLIGPAAGAQAGIEITDLTLDSRQVTRGAAFVALPGSREHGARYAGEALARGAAVVLYEPGPSTAAVPQPSVAVPGLQSKLGMLADIFYGRMGPAPKLFAVTGTNGKTTVAYLFAQALAHTGERCGYVGTLGFGRPPDLQAHVLTTPDCFTLHRELRELAVPAAALEVSSHALTQNRIAGLNVDVAAFTNLTRDHLDHHGDLARYGAAKAKLFERPELEHAVLNLDDAFARTLRAKLPAALPVIGVSLVDAGDAVLRGHVAHADLNGIEVAVRGRYGATRLRSPLVGHFNADNLMIALGALLAWGKSLTAASEALACCEAAPGRMEILPRASNEPYVVVDYAHTPDGLERVLASLRAVADRGEIWCVFGCGGERDKGKRPLMGALAGRGAEHVILTDDNPRGEDPYAIVEHIRMGVGTHPDLRIEHDRARAIATAIDSARGGDIVLIAGKGHERTQLVGRESRPFNDRDVALALLGGAA